MGKALFINKSGTQWQLHQEPALCLMHHQFFSLRCCSRDGGKWHTVPGFGLLWPWLSLLDNTDLMLLWATHLPGYPEQTSLVHSHMLCSHSASRLQRPRKQPSPKPSLVYRRTSFFPSSLNCKLRHSSPLLSPRRAALLPAFQPSANSGFTLRLVELK